MFDLPRRIPRRPSKDAEDSPRYQALADDEVMRSFEDIARRASDKTDELEFKSLGEGNEVKVPNSLGFVPNRMIPCREKFPYRVGFSRDDLADKEFIYVKTNAPKGTSFCARFERLEE